LAIAATCGGSLPSSGTSRVKKSSSHGRMRSTSSSVMPNMAPSTLALSGAAMSCTYSMVPCSRAAPASARAWARMVGSNSATVRGVNALFTSLRAVVCRGGSVVPSVLPMRWGMSFSRFPRFSLDHVCQSLNAATQSANRLRTQMSSVAE
jgi:hypothetical protein